ncbi:hypothetical protein L3Q82_022335 [Scortum barcoo]|uniref:Uncharacterized protein n=1 Tax=Scortum barcoo TaxID=214431 RepID=A0ACB8X217_9TELE|nr:hypothetical protein L3Q82_022335 [Scortum barcoo]
MGLSKAGMVCVKVELMILTFGWMPEDTASGAAVCQDAKVFSQTITLMFDHSSPAHDASQALFGLKQMEKRVIDYAIEFRTLEADSG